MDPLDNLRTARPCSAVWEQMAGDQRVRHCELCDLNVYNFAEMTRDEIRTLIARTEGRLCARLYRRADGTLLTSDCRRRSRRGRAVAALLAAIALVSGCAGTRNSQRSAIHIESESSATPQQASFSGVASDESGAPLPGVTIRIVDETSGLEITLVTDVNGAFAVASLKAGLYRVEATLAGVNSAIARHVALRENDVTRVRAVLAFDTADTVLVGAIAVDPLSPSNGISTTFTQDLIEKLPIGN